MPAGTIALTNNSATVNGTGTSFTTELKVGDFIGVMVGGTPYTLIVAAIASNTSLTIGSSYTGPTASGLAWYGIPASLKYSITQQVLNDMSRITRGMIADKANWQQVFSGTGTITVTLPDGSTFSGPAWNGIAASIDAKALKGANSDITSLSGLTTALSISQGGTGAKTAAAARTSLGLGGAATLNVGTVAGTVAAGDDGRLNTVGGKSGGTVTSAITVPAGSKMLALAGWAGMSVDNSVFLENATYNASTGQYVNFTQYNWSAGYVRTGVRRGGSTDINRYSISMVVNDTSGTTREWAFNSDGTATGAGAWVVSSDERHKEELQELTNALDAIEGLRCVSYKRWDSTRRNVGLIAQDVGKICPEAITKSSQPVVFSEDRQIEEFQYLDIGGFTAAYAFQALKELHQKVKVLERKLAEISN